MYKLDLERAEEVEIRLQTPTESQQNLGNSRKTLTLLHWLHSASLTTLKPLTERITTNCGKFLKRWEYQTTLPASRETCIQVKQQQLEPDKEQWTGSKLRKEYVKAIYCHPAYLTYMQSTSCKMLGWWNTSWNQDGQEKYQKCRWHHSSGRKWRGTKSLSHVRLFATPWTIWSMEFSRPGYGNGQPFPSPGALPNSGIEPRSPALQMDSLPAEPPGKPEEELKRFLVRVKEN